MPREVRLHVWTMKVEGNSDIHVVGPEQWMAYPSPWTCVDCIAGHRLEMNIFQMRDHVRLTHVSVRQDEVDSGFKSALQTIFKHWKDKAQAEAQAKKEAANA